MLSLGNDYVNINIWLFICN